MDLSSNKHMNVSMAAFDGLHDHTGGNAAGSAPKVQIFSGVSKGSTNSGNAVSSASISAGNVAGSLDLGKFGTFNQANPFRQDAPSMNTSSTTAEADDNLTLRKNAPRVNNINNCNSNGMEERCDDEDAHMNRRHGGGDVNGDDSQNEEERYNNIRHGSYGVRYKECLKNHAAKMGGYALDGCGEFMPAGEEGSLEGLRCAACGCHRNFHRREINGNGNTNATNMSLLALPSPINSSSTSANHNNVEYPEADHNHTNNGLLNVGGSPVAPTAGGLLRGHYAPGHLAPFLPHVHHHHHHPYVNPWMGSKLIGAAGHPPALQVHHASGGNGGSGGAMQFNPYNFGMGSPAHVSSAAAGGSGGGIVGGGSSSGKRFRTKFTMEQREKMFEFSEKIGWRIQKQDEAAVQQFCAETGVKRHVLKVWMHNNKNTFGKKLLRFPEAFNAVPESSS